MAEPRSVKEIFGEAVEMPARDRAEFLEGACGDDAPLRAEVEALLRVHGGAGGFLAAPTQAGQPPPGSSTGGGGPGGAYTTTDAAGERSGAVIGRYRLLEPIGEGGVGVVFMAEQREPVVRRVALKIIKLGMDTRQVIARFEAERQALAMMDHPGIATVLDAGATESGRPYFVMELVNGEPITRYCDRHRLTVRQRLELFIRVCEAVQHAHTKGVIHRDLKPGNVLVRTPPDGSSSGAVPKIIDFGVAKALVGTLTDHTLVTEQGQIIGTPEYMSPEQTEMGPKGIDTRTDVYSLGVLLYELLTGVLPFDPADLRSKGSADLRFAIREGPARPSKRLGGPLAAARSIANQRATRLDQLRRTLRRDLDWVPLKAMHNDRSRRYQSPSALADDIRLYLAGRAVQAGPGSILYRSGSFMRRHRSRLAVGLVLGIVALGPARGTRLMGEGLLILNDWYESVRVALFGEFAGRTAGTVLVSGFTFETAVSIGEALTWDQAAGVYSMSLGQEERLRGIASDRLTAILDRVEVTLGEQAGTLVRWRPGLRKRIIRLRDSWEPRRFSYEALQDVLAACYADFTRVAQVSAVMDFSGDIEIPMRKTGEREYFPNLDQARDLRQGRSDVRVRVFLGPRAVQSLQYGQ